jgi:hypothetical protein
MRHVVSCQLKELEKSYKKLNVLADLYQNRIRLIWTLNGHRNYLQKTVGKFISGEKVELSKQKALVQIEAGDIVTVLSREEIESTLNRRGALNGCVFVPEMFCFCGNTYRVYKRVVYFFDEVSERMCRCKDTVLLSAVHCSGERKVFSVPCDRNCFYFWNTRWLKIKEKVP